MLGGGLQLALIPAPLIVAAVIVFGLSPAQARGARLVAGIGALGSIALLAVEARFLGGGGPIQASLGSPVAGIDYLLRLDLPGAVLGLGAAVAGVLLLLDPRRETRQVSALLVSVTGSLIAALSGNMVMLVAGVEIAGVGTLLMTGAARGRLGRGGLVSIGLEHLASLGLAVAAVQLLTSTGTTDFSAIPAGAIGASVAGPWALAGAMRLLSPAYVPMRGSRTPTAAWATTGAIPCGALVILRLREVVGGPLPQSIAIGLAAAGGVAALWAGVVALRWSNVPAVAGRALCVLAAAPIVALSGVASPGTRAVAAGICALMLVVALTPAWEQIGRGAAGGALAALALLSAGALPVGFGMAAVILELAATISIGRAWAALAAALGLAALLGAAAAARAAAGLVASPAEARGTGGPISVLGGVAAGAAVVAAVVPGATSTTVLAALNTQGVVEPIGAAGIRSAAGDWAGGYLVVAFLVLAAGVWAFSTLAGRPLVSAPARGRSPEIAARELALGLRPARTIRPLLVRGAVALAQLDAWLVVQPQLALVLGGAVLALLLIH